MSSSQEIKQTSEEQFELETAEVKNGDQEQTQQGFIDLPTKYDSWEPIAELIATVVLAIATVATAWSGYQAARWGGVQSTSYSQAGALRTESTRASTAGGQIAQLDVGMFTNFINAFSAGDERLMTFYEERFRDEFIPAFEAWMATDPANNPDAPDSPFIMPQYSVSFFDEADRLQKEAEETFAKGMEANQTSDDYVLLTVFMASVLFLAGIQTRFKSIPARMLIILISLAILSYGLYSLITYPIN